MQMPKKRKKEKKKRATMPNPSKACSNAAITFVAGGSTGTQTKQAAEQCEWAANSVLEAPLGDQYSRRAHSFAVSPAETREHILS